MKAHATGGNGFVLDNVGTLSADGCEISWSQRWAAWRKQEATEWAHGRRR